jgi:hypothetical protein
MTDKSKIQAIEVLLKIYHQVPCWEEDDVKRLALSFIDALEEILKTA